MRSNTLSYVLLALLVWTAGCSDDPSTQSDADTQAQDVAADVPSDGVPDSSDLAMDAPQDAAGDGPDTAEDTGDSQDTEDTPDMPPPIASDCAPLPAPTGNVVMVTPAEADNLPQIVRDAAAGTTIVLADGTYTMSANDEGNRRLRFNTPDVTLRSASDDASTVILDGEYRTAEMLTVHADNVTIAHITVTHAIDHPIHVTPPDGTDNVTGTLLYGLRILDSGEQFIKVNSNGARSAWSDDGELACSYFELTDAGRPNVERANGGCYTGGIDAHGARGWVVRQNTFVDLYCAGEGLAEHAVHFWTGSRDTVVERNTIINCARGIGFGLRDNGERRMYSDDPGVGHLGHWGGLIRNNVIFANNDFHDSGMELSQARDVRIVHNTVFNDGGAGFYTSIDLRYANTRATLRNNIVRRFTNRNNATGDVDSSNLEDVDPSVFVDMAGGNLHIVPGSAPVDAGSSESDAGEDIDGEMRSDGSPDIGADEI